MIFLFILVAIALIIIFILKKSKMNKKKFVISTSIVIIITLLLLFAVKYNLIKKVVYEIYKNQPVITEETRKQSIAQITYTKIMGIDAQTYEYCYILKNNDESYYYYMSKCDITIAGLQEEKIYKTGNIKNKKQLEKILKEYEEKIDSNSSDIQLMKVIYNGQEISKEELKKKLFN